VAVLGPNGAGKTTLFKLLLGLLKRKVREMFWCSANRRAAAMRTSATRLSTASSKRILALRARDVVGFGLDGNKWGIGFGNRKRSAAIDAVLKEVDAYQFRHAPVGQLVGRRTAETADRSGAHHRSKNSFARRAAFESRPEPRAGDRGAA
jgi:zinc/manganese transport system ATP-binding protein